MNADMFFQAWGDTLVTTAVLVLMILVIRKPFARHFGPGLTYALWAVPALRLMLPPLPFADPVVAPVVAAVPVSAAPMGELILIDAVDTVGAAPAAPALPLWSFADLLPLLFAVWAAGMVGVLAAAMLSHRRFRREVLTGAVELEPIGSIRLVMTDAVDGPVAFGLWRRFVAVPQDFFARYVAEERALAIDHELAHHRHGDLWANAAALLLLSVQWFNPLAWRAIRAFRFDQEAACDARVLTMVGSGTDSAPRNIRTARYATAIAKAAVGSRLSLAAPMAVHDNLQERLTMLMQDDISKKRGLVGRLLVGGATLAVLATTATLVPAGIASATAQTDVPVPPAPPAPPEAPDAPAAPEAPEVITDAHRVMIFTSDEDGEGEAQADDGKKKREVHRIVIRNGEVKDGEGNVTMFAPGDAKVKRFEMRMPGALSRDDILATLKEQGITGSQADAIADKLEAKRKKQFAFAPMPPMAPLPPMPPMPPMNWQSVDGKSFGFAHCGKGQAPMPLVNRDDKDGKKHSRVMMVRCGTPGDKAAQLSALKKAREQFAEGRASTSMSDEIRAKVTADLDKAIADLEKNSD